MTTTPPAHRPLITARSISAITVAVAGGLIAIVLRGVSAPSADRTAVVGFGVSIALAAMLAGALVGFLFGMPQAKSGQHDADPSRPFQTNTNLGQVSDWLTKLLLGATLVQLGPIANGAGRLFALLGDGLGKEPGAASFAGAVVVYFAVVGFLLAWLATGLYLTPALNELDVEVVRKIKQARAAEAMGDVTTAKKLRGEAAGLLASVQPIAQGYEDTRAAMPASVERTRALESQVAEARRIARTMPGLTKEAVVEMFGAGEGERITALAFMQERPELIDIATVCTAINPSTSAFEQFHALVVADIWAHDHGDPADVPAVLDAIHRAEADTERALGADRRAVAHRILEKLGS